MQVQRVAILVIAAALPALRAAPAEAKSAEAHHLGRPVSAWQAELTSESAQARFDALVALTAIGPDAVAALDDVTRLGQSDPHPQVRERAFGTLAAFGPRGYEVVIKGLAHRDAALRGICCDVLTWGTPPRRAAAKALRGVLADPVVTVRYLAAFALTAVDPMADDALPVLQQALGETNPAAVIGACTAAARLGHRARPLLPALLAVLRSTEEKVLVAAAQALRGMDPSIVPRVVERAAALPSNPSARIVLIGAAAHLGRGAAGTAERLLPFLRDVNTQVALGTVDALVRIDAPSAKIVRELETAAIGELGHSGLLRAKALEALAAFKVPLAERVIDSVRIALARSEPPETYGMILKDFPNGLAVFAKAGDPGAPTRSRARWLRGLATAAANADDPRWGQAARRVVLEILEQGPADLREQAAEHVPGLFADDPSIVARLATTATATGSPACGRILAHLLSRALEDRDPWHTAGAPTAPVADPTQWRAAGEAVVPVLGRIARGEDVEASLAARIAAAYVAPEDPAARAGCLAALAGPELAGRRAAAACLATLEPGTPEVIAALERVLKNRSENPVVRRTAAVALARQGRAADALIESRVRETRGAERRFWLVALGRAGTRLAHLLPDVVEDLEAEQDAVRDAAIEVIRAMGPSATAIGPAIAQLLAKRSRRRRVGAMRALAALGPLAAPWVPAMFDAVASEPRGERARFAGWLTEVGHGAVEILAREAATPGDWERRLVALNVLARIGGPAATQAGAIGQVLAADDSTVRVAACDLLEALGSPAAAARGDLVGALDDPVGRVRARAARALANMGPLDPKQRSALERLSTNDAHGFVRDAARDTLRALDGSGVEGKDDR